LQKGVITEENFEALMILCSEIGGHVLTPFLDTYIFYAHLELIKCRSADGAMVTSLQGSYRWRLMPMGERRNMTESRKK